MGPPVLSVCHSVYGGRGPCTGPQLSPLLQFPSLAPSPLQGFNPCPTFLQGPCLSPTSTGPLHVLFIRPQLPLDMFKPVQLEPHCTGTPRYAHRLIQYEPQIVTLQNDILILFSMDNTVWVYLF